MRRKVRHFGPLKALSFVGALGTGYPIACAGRGSVASRPSREEEHARVACRLQYNGTHFHGWEAKPALRTVEATLSEAVSDVVGSKTKIFAASRTDAGTHALGQVVHFDVKKGRAMARARAWVGALNRRLPNDVRIDKAAFANSSFDARRSASSRRYRYSIYTSPQPSVFLEPLTWHFYQRHLDVTKMNAAAQCLKTPTRRDLSAFRKTGASASHTVIAVSEISVKRFQDCLVEIEVEASWFVYGMMRLLVATLVQVGTGVLSESDFINIVSQRNRREVKFSAPPNGLSLLRVGYPVELNPFSSHDGLDGARQLVYAMRGHQTGSDTRGEM